jgi:hypothetical protein
MQGRYLQRLNDRRPVSTKLFRATTTYRLLASGDRFEVVSQIVLQR